MVSGKGKESRWILGMNVGIFLSSCWEGLLPYSTQGTCKHCIFRSCFSCLTFFEKKYILAVFYYTSYHKAGGTDCTRTLNRSRERILCKNLSHKTRNFILMIQREEEVTAAWTQALVALNLWVTQFIDTLKWGVKDVVTHFAVGYMAGSRSWDIRKRFNCCSCKRKELI